MAGGPINAVNNSLTSQTGTGSFVGSNGPTLVTPVLGTPSSGVLTNCTGLSLATGVVGNLPKTNLNSGTGASATTFWRGDEQWATPSVSGSDFSISTWVDVTGATQSIAVATGYTITHTGSGCVLTLPATAAIGAVFLVQGVPGSGGWQIAQNSGQSIIGGSIQSTTPGVTGTLSSDIPEAVLQLRCCVADTTFMVEVTNSSPVFA